REPDIVRADQAEDDAAHSYGGERGAANVERSAALRAALGNAPPENREDDRRDRHVDEEHQSPRRVLHDPPAEHWPEHSGNGSERGPGADRAPAFFGRKRRADDRETTRDEQ